MSLDKKMMAYIESSKKEIEAIANDLYNRPEAGFKEFETQAYLENYLDKMQIPYETFEGMTGVKVTLSSGKDGPSVALIAELDAVICPQHKDSAETGAVHACGHNIMMSDVLFVIDLFIRLDVMKELTGNVHFLFVPAEEYLEMDYRQSLIKDGIIKYPTGKAECISRGIFDDVDISVMIHAISHDKKICLEGGSNGFVAKKAIFTGKASHAASAPEKGKNALYAANLGLTAINAIRETFVNSGNIRVHPVIHTNQQAVNVIPSEVVVETFVRANSVETVLDTNLKVDRALIGSAYAIDCDIRIENTPGMLPLTMNKGLTDLGESVGHLIVGNDVTHLVPSSGSTDLGDVSSLMPAIETCIGCIKGGLHSPDYEVIDKETAYVFATQYLALMAYELLKDQASLAKQIIEEYEPVFKTKKDYFDFLDSMFSNKTYKADILGGTCG
ncbi:amidohydrolase [Acidaminobacter sp. JC074]|uniref:amidohydrolase n=1 Tax=Acidaminobacter sp. JC074 TaxID=2530199 RepID=UPI001F0E9368|nr:amidohydrolase [Acidaminobacter sp. JC074]